MPRVLPPAKGRKEWLLWFQGRDNKAVDSDVVKLTTGSIFHCSSPDGISNFKFHPDSPVMGPNKENGYWYMFDSEHVGLGDVITPGGRAQSKILTTDSVFFAYIFGGNRDTETLGNKVNVKGMKMEIGVAVSQDGAHWSRVEGPTAYGAILPVGSKVNDDFDSIFVGWPCVLEVGSEYWMYYHTYNAKSQKYEVGLAIAKDGIMKWEKKGSVFSGGDVGSFDCKGVSRCHVIKLENGGYKMWYEGVSQDGKHSIGLATSSNGIVWERASNNPVFTASSSDSGAWDSGGVGSPHLVWLPEKRRWRMYYVGTPLNNMGGGSAEATDDKVATAGIGAAESLDEDGMIFERI